MNQEPSEKSIERVVWAALIIVVLVIAAAYLMQTFRRRSEDALTAARLPVINRVTDFALTNQLGQNLRLSDFLGRVWVADVIFTRCPGPCVQMTRSMNEIRNQFLGSDDIVWASITADPDHDTPEILKEYVAKWVEHPRNWHFLTGSKAAVKRLSVDDLKLVVVEKDAVQRISDEDLFLHSTKFVLLDRHGRLRGIYEGTDQAARESLAKDLRNLVTER